MSHIAENDMYDLDLFLVSFHDSIATLSITQCLLMYRVVDGIVYVCDWWGKHLCGLLLFWIWL